MDRVHSESLLLCDVVLHERCRGSLMWMDGVMGADLRAMKSFDMTIGEEIILKGFIEFFEGYWLGPL